MVEAIVGLNLKIFGQPLGGIISSVQESSIQRNSTANKTQDTDYDEPNFGPKRANMGSLL